MIKNSDCFAYRSRFNANLRTGRPDGSDRRSYYASSGNHDICSTYLLGGACSTIGTKKALKEICFHREYYPKRYIMPGRRFRKFFRLRKSEIPKWIYIEFCMTFVYIALFVVFLLLYVLLYNKLLVAETYFWIYVIIMGVDMLRIFVCVILYR